MRSATIQIVAFVCGLVVLVPARGEEKEIVQSFQVTGKMLMEMDTKDENSKGLMDYKVRCTFKRKGKEGSLTVDEIRLKANEDDKGVIGLTITKDKITRTTDGKSEEIAPARLRDDEKMLKKSIGTPVWKLRFDEDGKGVQWTMLVDPQNLLARDHRLFHLAFPNCLARDLRLFHHALPPKEDRWEANFEMPSFQSSHLRDGSTIGKLKYEKTGTKGSQTLVKFSGTLLPVGVKPKEEPVVLKDERIDVNGRLTYDSDKKQWIAGDIHVQFGFRLDSGGIELGSAKGTKHLKLEMLPGK